MHARPLVLLVLLLSAGAARAAEQPNILFIFTDDQSHRTVGCYDAAYSWVRTPNIDRLARQGVRFDYAYMGTWCMPSRAAMLTGHHTYGVESMRMEGQYPRSTYDPNKCPFWPSVFRQHGYNTAQIGKWHTGVDTSHGRDWDYQVVWNRPRHAKNAGQYYDDQLIEVNGGEAKLVEGYTTDWYTDRAVEYLQGKHREADKPWYLWLCYGAVHGPFLPADRHRQAVPEAKVDAPADVYHGSRDGKPDYVKKMDIWIKGESGQPALRKGVTQRTVDNQPIHGNTLSGWVRQYHQGVLALDEAVARLMKTLEETGQADNTIVVFAADQGLAWGQHGFQQKLAPYDANIRGPLIIRYPGVAKAGGVCPAPVAGVDLPPTFFALAGIELPWKMHGDDLTPQLKNPQAKRNRPMLMAHTGMSYGSDTDQIPTDEATLFATRNVPWWLSLHDGRYKYIRTLMAGEIEELYDLQSDPEELTNLALEPEHAARVKRMRRALLAELKRTDAGMLANLPAVKPLP